MNLPEPGMDWLWRDGRHERPRRSVLPGDPLPILGYRLEPPYSLRDDGCLVLCYGSEDVVERFEPAKFGQVVTIRLVEMRIRLEDARRRADAALIERRLCR